VNYAEKVVIGDCTLYRGNTRELIQNIEKQDLLLTDPPYGIASKMVGASGKFKIGIEGFKVWDNSTIDFFNDLVMPCSVYKMVWGGNYYSMPPSRCWLIYHKTNALKSFADAELCYTNLDANTKLFAGLCNGWDRVHPTQKPIELMRWCLSFVPKAKTVIDPFMGSGTTGVACAELGLKFTGIEREKSYFDHACTRIEQAYNTPQLIPVAPQIQTQETFQL
jgi:DNA modification methylase